jgi:hypothetical protein
MADALDLLQCPVCGTFYVPETTPTGRTWPHCTPPVERGFYDGHRVVKWLDGAVYVDFEAIERRVLERYGLTEDVVDPPLTGLFLDIEV